VFIYRVERVTACGSKVGKLNVVGGPEVCPFHYESDALLSWDMQSRCMVNFLSNSV
jgi:hypothetical protein